jgi:hypothetical protein
MFRILESFNNVPVFLRLHLAPDPPHGIQPLTHPYPYRFFRVPQRWPLLFAPDRKLKTTKVNIAGLSLFLKRMNDNGLEFQKS